MDIHKIMQRTEMICNAYAQSGRRAVEDDVLRKMALASTDLVTVIAGMDETDDEVRKFGLALFMLGFMAHEENWVDLEWHVD